MQTDLRSGFPEKRPVSFDQLTLPPVLRVVILAPHPDDFDAIAVTARRLCENGNVIELAVATSGASGVEDGFDGAVTADDKSLLREREQRASCLAFGLAEDRIRFLRLQEDAGGHPEDSVPNYARVCEYLAVKRPDLLFLPHGNDPNLGHQRVCQYYRRYASQSGAYLAAFLNRDPKTIQMRDDVYTPFDEESARWKAALLRIHRSQQERNLNVRGHGFDERILQLNRSTAASLPCRAAYAESFEIEFSK